MKKNFKSLLLCFLSIPMLMVVGCNKEEQNSQPSSETPAEQRTLIGDMLKAENEYSIIIPKLASKTEQSAASELVYYFQKATGVTLQIVNDKSPFLSENSSFISIGDTTVFAKAARKHGIPDLSKEALNEDGFNIFTYGNNVLINAFCDRGKLYGTYEFIEDTLGVKFLNYRYTSVPELSEVNLYSYDKSYVPYFQQRAYLNTPVFFKNQPYAAHMRFNSDYCPIDESLGGYTEWCSFNGNTSHTLCEIIPVSDYQTNERDSDGNPVIVPEYREVFSHKGTGANCVSDYANNIGYIDYCLTNGLNEDGTYDSEKEISTVKLAIESLKKFILANPTCENYMIGQADTPNGCTCERCTAAQAKYKGGGRIIRFVNVLSDEINKWIKEEGLGRTVNLTCFAYHYTNEPPVENGKPIDDTVIPRDNVYIKYAPINIAYYYSPLDEHQPYTAEGDRFKEWSIITDRFHAWTYHTWFSNWAWYYDTISAMQDTMQMLYDRGVVYHFAQGGYLEYNLYQTDIDAYVFSNLCWDLNGDVEYYRNEYIRNFFGEAAYEDILGFNEEIANRYAYLETIGENLKQGTNLTKAEYWPYELTNRLVKYFKDAETKTMNNSNLSEEEKTVYVENIQRASISALYMRLSLYGRYAGISNAELSRVAKEFVDMAEKYSFNRYGENSTSTLADLKQKYGVN